MVGVKVIIGTVFRYLYFIENQWAVGDTSLIACVILLRYEIRPIFVFLTKRQGCLLFWIDFSGFLDPGTDVSVYYFLFLAVCKF